VPTVTGLGTSVAAKVSRGQLVIHVDDAPYSATGNGTADDTAAFVAALTAARSAGAILRLGFGKTYIVSAALNPTGVRIEGFGATVKLKPGITANFNVFAASAAFSAQDLRVDLNKANTTDPAVSTQGMGFYLFSGTGWSGVARLRGVEVVNGYQPGIRFGTTFAGTDATDPALSLSRAMLEGVVVDGCKWGVFMQNTRGVIIDHAEVSNCTAEGVYDYLSSGNQVIGGRFATNGSHNVMTQYSSGFEVLGIQSTAATKAGICVGGGSTTVMQAKNFRIADNHVRGCTESGIQIDPTKTGAAGVPQVVNGAVTGNVVDGNGVHGIYLHNCQYVTVTGNLGINHQTSISSGGLAMDSYGVAVSGNIFTGNKYGIKFQGTAATGMGSHRIGRNVVESNTTTDYYYDSHGADNTTLELSGIGVPAVTAPVGSTYRRTDGGAGTSFYVKESGGVTGTGWVAK
jgi:parallel beta-helix repeat protein